MRGNALMSTSRPSLSQGLISTFRGVVSRPERMSSAMTMGVSRSGSTSVEAASTRYALSAPVATPIPILVSPPVCSSKGKRSFRSSRSRISFGPPAGQRSAPSNQLGSRAALKPRPTISRFVDMAKAAALLADLGPKSAVASSTVTAPCARLASTVIAG